MRWRAVVPLLVVTAAVASACTGGQSSQPRAHRPPSAAVLSSTAVATSAPTEVVRSSVTPAGSTATLLRRPIRLPRVHGACPATTVRPLHISWGGVTGGIDGYAAGRGPVVLVLSEESVPLLNATVDGRHLVRRAVVPLGASSAPGWGALKTVWLASPTYSAPFLVRGKRLDGIGPIAIGGDPEQSYFVMPAGAAINGGDGYRPGTAYVWVRQPGCYGFQIDGPGYTATIIIAVVAASTS